MTNENTIKKSFNPLMWSIIICMPLIIVAFTIILGTLILGGFTMGIIFLILNLFKIKKKQKNEIVEKQFDVEKFDIDLKRYKNYFDKKINIKVSEN